MTSANLSAVRLVLVARLAGLSATVSAAPSADAAKITILTGPTRSAVSEIFGPRLAEALQAAFSVDVQDTPGSWENLVDKV